MKKGIFICFTGTDGSGKTTHAKNLNKYIKNSGKSCNYIWCGWRCFDSFLFRPIVKFVKNICGHKKEEHGTNKYSEANSNIILGYFTMIDYILKTLPSMLSSLYRYDYVIADRFIYDVMVGFSISYKKINIKRFFWIFPRPDIIFFIDTPEYVAYNRKGDIPSIEYLYRQKSIYQKLFDEYDMLRIDGTKNIEDISNMIKTEVIKIGK